jgi:hypothetical protein
MKTPITAIDRSQSPQPIPPSSVIKKLLCIKRVHSSLAGLHALDVTKSERLQQPPEGRSRCCTLTRLIAARVGDLARNQAGEAMKSASWLIRWRLKKAALS